MQTIRRKPKAENLTPRRISALKPGEEVWDTVVPGFHVRRGERRTTYWLRYRLHGSQRRYKIGAHPVLTLAKAREDARDAIRKVGRGEDPAAQRAEGRQTDLSFAAMAREMLDAKSGTTREKTRAERERILSTELLPRWGGRPAASITRRDVVGLLDRIAERAPTMAARTLEVIRGMYNEALRRGFPTVEANPAHMVRPPAHGEGRERYLSRDEIKAVWKATAPENVVTRSAFRIALLTGQRIGSVCAMRWADIDGAHVWTIPASANKGKRSHMVPLSREVLEVLDDLRTISGDDEYALPGRADGRTPHLNSHNAAMRRIRKRSGVDDWHVHDFRRTWRTWATRSKDEGGLAVAPAVADLVLGHAEASLGWSKYQGDRDRYMLSEKRAALVAWGAWVRKAVGK